MFMHLWGMAGSPEHAGQDDVVLYLRIKVATLIRGLGCSRSTVHRGLAALRGARFLMTRSTGRYLEVTLFVPLPEEVAPLFCRKSPRLAASPPEAVDVSEVTHQMCQKCDIRCVKSDTSHPYSLISSSDHSSSNRSRDAGQETKAEVADGPAAAAAAAVDDRIVEKLRRLTIGEPKRSELARLPGVTLNVVDVAQSRWLEKREVGRAGTGLLITMIQEEADAQVQRRRDRWKVISRRFDPEDRDRLLELVSEDRPLSVSGLLSDDELHLDPMAALEILRRRIRRSDRGPPPGGPQAPQRSTMTGGDLHHIAGPETLSTLFYDKATLRLSPRQQIEGWPEVVLSGVPLGQARPGHAGPKEMFKLR